MRVTIKNGINKQKSFSELRDEIIKFKEEGGSQNEAQRILEELRNDFEDNEEKEDIILDLLDHVTGWCQARHRIWEGARLFYSEEDEISKRNLVIEEDGNSIWAYLTFPNKVEIDKDCYLGSRNKITLEKLDIKSLKKTKLTPPMIMKYSTKWSQVKDLKGEDLLIKWFLNGNVLLQIKGNPFLFFHEDEPKGFSKSIKENCKYGNTWSNEKYNEILK